MPIVAVPFIFIGLVAKIANRRYIKINQVAVHTNRESQLFSLVETIASNINDEVLGSLYKNGLFDNLQEATITIKN
jgi:hypothetical protein